MNINEIVSSVISALRKLSEKNYIYNLAISGPVASGKTTLCNFFNNAIINSPNYNQVAENYNFYNEWIDHNGLAKMMLSGCANGKVGRLTLQSFILDEWINQLTERPLKNFNLFERIISECSLAFCDDLDKNTFDVLFAKEDKIAKQFNIPHINGVFKFYGSQSSDTQDMFMELCNTILHDIDYMLENNISTYNRIFGLSIPSAEILARRVQKRNRNGEENIAMIDKMQIQVDKYKKIYREFLMKSLGLGNEV